MNHNEIIEFITGNQEEYSSNALQAIFGLDSNQIKGVIKILLENKTIVETSEGKLKSTKDANTFRERHKVEAMPLIEEYLKKHPKKEPKITNPTTWEDLTEIEEFLIYPGEEKIYEIKVAGKTIKMEGKEIIDYKIFILKFFEEFGTMLKTYKGVTGDWSTLVSSWNKNYGRIVNDMSEHLSASLEGREAVIDYVNGCSVTDDYIVKDGMVTYKHGCIYVPTKSIKRVLKKYELFITIRKLGFEMKDYLISGSIPIKIENKSERFWRMDPKKLELNLDSFLHLEKEEEQEEEEKESDTEEPILPHVIKEPPTETALEVFTSNEENEKKE